MLELRIQQHFIESADLQYQAAEPLSKPITAAVQAILAQTDLVVEIPKYTINHAKENH